MPVTCITTSEDALGDGSEKKHTGCDDFMANAASMAEQVNDDGALWRAVTEHWWARYGDKPVGVKELFVPVILHHNLFEDALGDGSEKSQHTKFGKQLRNQLGAVYGGLKIVGAGRTRNSAATYRLEPMPGFVPPKPADASTKCRSDIR